MVYFSVIITGYAESYRVCRDVTWRGTWIQWIQPHTSWPFFKKHDLHHQQANRRGHQNPGGPSRSSCTLKCKAGLSMASHLFARMGIWSELCLCQNRDPPGIPLLEASFFHKACGINAPTNHITCCTGLLWNKEHCCFNGVSKRGRNLLWDIPISCWTFDTFIT